MEFNEKLQQLRKQKDITQEELAEILYVSRTAISKWESGRGLPNLESLKAISKFFSVSIDDLISGEELITFAETEQKRKAKNIRDLAFGVLDCMVLLLFFLPIFSQEKNGTFVTIPLISTTNGLIYIWLSYMIIISSTIGFGIAELALQNYCNQKWLKSKIIISFALSFILICFTMANMQPYPGILVMCVLVMKIFLLWKQP